MVLKHHLETFFSLCLIPNLVVLFLRFWTTLLSFYVYFLSSNYSSEIYLGHLSNLFLLKLSFILRLPTVTLIWITKLFFIELLSNMLDFSTYMSHQFKAILKIKLITKPQYPCRKKKKKGKTQTVPVP